MKIVGIDPSLTCSGVAVVYGPTLAVADVIRPEHWTRRAPQSQDERVQRMHEIVASMVSWCVQADLVVLEGLAFDGHDNRRQLAGLSWIAQYRFRELGMRVAVAPPSNVKQWATGKGNAGKKDMIVAAEEMFPGVEIPTDDAADALLLAAAGAQWLGCPVADTSPERLSHLRGIAWPMSDLAA